MARLGHVDPQLMAAPGTGHQPDAGLARLMRDHLPVGDGRAARCMVDMLARTVGPVHGQGQIDAPLGRVEPAPQPGDVDLLDRPRLELSPQFALRSARPRKDDEARGIEVQAVHQQDIGKPDARPGDQAIGPVFTPTGNRKQPRRLVQDQEVGVMMDHAQRIIGRRVGERRSSAPLTPAVAKVKPDHITRLRLVSETIDLPRSALPHRLQRLAAGAKSTWDCGAGFRAWLRREESVCCKFAPIFGSLPYCTYRLRNNPAHSPRLRPEVMVTSRSCRAAARKVVAFFRRDRVNC